MRYTSLPIDPDRLPAAHAGFRYPSGGFGAEQRDSLRRGIAFVLVLAFSCLLIVYAPLVWEEPDWAAAGGRPGPVGQTATIGARANFILPR